MLIFSPKHSVSVTHNYVKIYGPFVPLIQVREVSWWPHNFTNENSGHLRTFQDIFAIFSGYQRGKSKDILGQFSSYGQFIRTQGKNFKTYRHI